MSRSIFAGVVVVACLAHAAAHAQGGADAAAPLPILYVDQFEPVTRASDGFGPIHALESGLHAHRTDRNAAALARALVTALSNEQIVAQALSESGQVPTSGWLVRGVFYSTDAGGHRLRIPFLGGSKTPDVEVTVTLTDCAKAPGRPFAVLGTDAVLKGQGAPVGWNPYVVAARFVVHQVEADQSLDGLAKQIARKIAESRTELAQQDLAAR